MAHLDDPISSLRPPEITLTDLHDFFQVHFSPASLEHFGTLFLGPVETDQDPFYEDDGLGYYPDGIKRTLTDEQIAMFKHSEIQVLLKERRHDQENKPHRLSSGDPTSEVEDGELADTADSLGTPYHEQTPQPAKNEQLPNRLDSKRQRSEHKKSGGHKQQQQHVKPDLRKRTWDRVDRGLASLDYSEEEDGGHLAPAPASQRRRISYDDV